MIDETLFEAEEKMERAVEHAKEEFAAIRTGRATPAMFSRILVDYYGAPTPITQMASVGIPEPRMVIVKPYDASQLGPIERAIRDSDLGVNPNNEGTQLRIHLPQMASITVPEARMAVIKPYDMSQLAAIEKAIRDSDLGVNPTNDGQVLRVIFPQLTEERRRDLVKMARAKGEDAKVAIRNIRRRAKEELDRIVKDGEAGEDEVGRAEKELEQVTKRHVDVIDELLRHKETELLEV